MPIVPAFLLRRLYVKTSLTNTLTGWEFTLKNTLGSGYAHGLLPLRIDNSQDVPMENTKFENDGVEVSFDQVNKENTFGLQMNRSIVISVVGEQLSADGEQVGQAVLGQLPGQTLGVELRLLDHGVSAADEQLTVLSILVDGLVAAHALDGFP